jgi:hypothetical protein
MEEILEEITTLLLDVDKVRKKLYYIFRYTDRTTGELKKPKRIRPDLIEKQQADLEENLIGLCYQDFIKKKKENKK